MGKNNNFIAKAKLIQQAKNDLVREAMNVTPAIYGAIATVLVRDCHWNQREVETVFALSQQVWTHCAENGIRVHDYCEEVTGIDFQLGDMIGAE